MELLFTVPELRCLAGLYLILFTRDCGGPAVDSVHWTLCLSIPLICFERFLHAYPGLKSVGLWLLIGIGGAALLIVACLPFLLAGAPAAVVAAIGVLLSMSAVVLTDLSLIGYCSSIVPANVLMPAVLSLGLVSFAGVAHLIASTAQGATYAVPMNFAVALSLVILIKTGGRLEVGPLWNPGISGQEEAVHLERLLLIQRELAMAMQTAAEAFASQSKRPASAIGR
jgi:hypothetical protein